MNHRRDRSVCLSRKGGRMRRYIYFLIVVVFIGCGTISGCGKTQEEDKQEVTADKVKKEAKEALDTTMGYAQEKSREYHDKMVKLVEQMLSLNKQLASAKTAHDKTILQRQIDATDKQIDNLVYELYGLTDEEIKIVESS